MRYSSIKIAIAFLTILAVQCPSYGQSHSSATPIATKPDKKNSVTAVYVPTRHNSAVGDVVEGFQYSVATDQPSYSAGQSIILSISLKNTTDSYLRTLRQDEVEAAPNILVQTLDGKDVPLTAYGQAGYVKPDFTSAYQPGHETGELLMSMFMPKHVEVTFTVLLNRLYDLSKKGTYVVTVKQWVPRQDHKGVAVLSSAPIRFDVFDEGITVTPLPTNPRAIQ